MKYSREFFYDEVKEGFYISSIMKSVRAAQLDVLDQIAAVCERHNIKWFADCGTLLGAVRHGGYIPWDDDLDICMLRADYTRFHQYVQDELPEGYLVRTHENGELWQIKSHIVNRSKMTLERKEFEATQGCPFCTGVDIFVLDYLAPNPGEEEVRKKLIQSALAIADNGSAEETFTDDVMELLKMVEETCGVTLDHSTHLRRQMYGLAEKLAALYPEEGAKEVALMPFWSYYNTHRYPIECVNNITQIPFEDRMINVPAGYDQVLKIEYGDYLRVVRGGGMHDYPIFQNQVEELAAIVEMPDLFEYIFDEKDLITEREPKPLRLREKSLKICELLEQVQKHISGAMEMFSTEEVITMLEQCQDSAIQIGNEIEQTYGEGFATVSHIERYCEKLYEISQILYGEEGELSESLGDLAEILRNIRGSIMTDLRDRKTILFLPFRDRYWDSFAPMYQKASEDPDNDVYVMPLPYYDRDFLGKLGDLHYEISGYPKDVRLLDYRNYDIKEHHPDVIYTQYAYDLFHFSITLPSQYYTSELKKYTEELIYVPYFRIGAFENSDEKFRQTTRYFVKIPGLMHADKVLVESEQMRDLYISELTSFCGEETKAIWEKKITQYTEEQTADTDKNLIPEKWKALLSDANGKKKKTVLYMVTVSSLYRYRRQMTEKIERVLQMFYERRDQVALVFRPHPAIQYSMDLFDRDTWLDYQKIVAEYRRAGWGVLDESEDATDAIAVADAYYGDADVVMHKCRNMGKPVMIGDPMIP
ncbi:MAG: LicD family protein [Lachnospiraceae bacterium]|nr:LicD family protein [Lachnospiraceae bacterium]